jgi:hypothetical protein
MQARDRVDEGKKTEGRGRSAQTSIERPTWNTGRARREGGLARAERSVCQEGRALSTRLWRRTGEAGTGGLAVRASGTAKLDTIKANWEWNKPRTEDWDRGTRVRGRRTSVFAPVLSGGPRFDPPWMLRWVRKSVRVTDDGNPKRTSNVERRTFNVEQGTSRNGQRGELTTQVSGREVL